MSLVQVHVDLFTTTQRPNNSVKAYYKLFCARRDTVNAHGGEAGFHMKLYAMARTRIMAEKGRDEAWMTSAVDATTGVAEKTAIEKQAQDAC